MKIESIGGGLGTAAATTATGSELGQEDFLALMVAQFKNQDPFKPMENGDFLGQMAQFSSVSGLQELNARFESLASALGGDQAIGAAQLIGREGLFPGPQLQTAEAGEQVNAAVYGAHPGGVTVEVIDASGQTIRQLGIEAGGIGVNRFAWDGRDERGALAPAGSYTLRAYTRQGGQQAELPTLIAARIEGIAFGGSGGVELNVRGLAPQALSSVREITANEI